MIETVYDFAGKLDHGSLVLAGGDGGGLERRYVACLADGVAEETYGNRLFEIAHLDLGLHRGITLHTAHAHQIHVVKRQFGKLGHLALDEYGGLGRVEARGEIVESNLDDVLTHFLRIVGIVGERLAVGNHHIYLIELAGILEFDATAQGTHEMAEMKAPGGTVARQYDFFHMMQLMFLM